MTWWAARTARSERGTSLTEYALIITVISLGMVGLIRLFGDEVTGMWAAVAALA